MATVTKNLRIKNKKVQNSSPTDSEDVEKVPDIISPKKKPIDIDEPEPVVGLDEKTEEDSLLGATGEEDSGEEISLDGEDLNPFGDRWEV